MKIVKTVAKILLALAAVAGAVYVIATYGNQIVAWCKKLLRSLPCCKCECECEEAAVAEEVPIQDPEAAEEAPVEEAPVEEAPAEETAVAEEADFEG